MEAQANEAKLLYLASGSPRRQELLHQLNLDFEVVNAPVEEVALPNESPESYVRRIAIEKAFSGFNKVAGKKIWVIGGDTAVVLNGKVFGKPKNEADAHKMLRLLSAKTHVVLSAVAVLFDGEAFSALNKTEVTFRELSEDEIHAYWLSGEPEGKAGSYAIQGLGARFIENIKGSYSGVMGLPLFELDQLLTASGYLEKFKGIQNA
ncbi:Maf family protein [Thiomicrorhabdus sp. ZW0627]|uniref:Maf family protein n=1 Tax=Thiomicrorhabdus sp. ZW0627 TaxID=3039774 RepID=UPI0024368526|nr:Maf family protein [Thiomicrorhabdus sp. ZW0627]MDG6774938.1 Maf family protein [Thiomicrorhabdus sp. ZW0627]